MKHFEISETGQYHINRGSDICQDWKAVRLISEDVIVLSVADGVGSEEHSEYASKAACEACVEHIQKYFETNEDRVDLIEQSFHAAYFAVEATSS